MTQTSPQHPEILLEALRGQADIALAKLRASATSKHSSIKGGAREEVVREFIRCFLPSSYAIGHGEVFSDRNDRSKQVDVIIHDDVFSPVFKVDGGSIHVPCEAVYGIAEVKTRLDSKGWETALANIASVKRLTRAPSDPTDILPNRRLRLSSRFKVPDKPSNPYVGIVVGLRGLSAERFASDLNERMNRDEEEKALLPDLIACVENGHLITRFNKGDGQQFQIGTATLGSSYDGFRAFHVQDFVLSSLHLGLNVLLSGIRLRNRNLAPNWLDELLWVEKKSEVERVFALFEQAGAIPPQGGWDVMEAEARARGEYDLLSKVQDLRRKPPV